MYVEIIPNRSSPPAILLRQSTREGEKIRKTTLANLSHLTIEQARALQAVFRGETLAAPGAAIEKLSDRQHGAVEAVRITMRRLGLDSLIDPRPSRQRNLVLAMVAARIVMPRSKLATARSWGTTTLPQEMGVAGATEKDLYAAMDWLATRQESIEERLAARHLKEGGMVLYDLSSSYFEGEACELAKRGYSRDGCPGTLQVNYGLLTDDEGRPVALSVFSGNVADSKTFMAQVKKVQTTFKLKEMVIVGDRGMITKAHVTEMSQMEGVDWITALKSGAIRALVEDTSIKMELFDKMNLFEITHPDYPGERLVVCRNTELAKRRAHKRAELIEATRKKLDEVRERVGNGKPRGKAAIGVAVGKIVNKYKMAKHFVLKIESRAFSYELDQANIDDEARLDGIYVVRTSVRKEKVSPDDTVRNYKRLTRVERAFRCYKTVDLKARPIHHYAAPRVSAHLFLCMLAYYVEWHMQRAWRGLLFSDETLDEHRLDRDPVAPAKPSESAKRKAKTKKTPDGQPVHSFTTLLGELACVVRSTCRAPALGKSAPTFEFDTTPSVLQRQALDLVRALPVYPVS